MKKRLFTLGTISFFFFMLLFPHTAFTAASRGLMLWFRTVLPTLLPFMITAGLLVRTGGIYYIAGLTGRAAGRFLHVSDCGSFAVIAGFLCGYPMGAKVTADLLREKKISYEEAGYLLSFCNNISPMFMISYVAGQNIRRPAFFAPSVIIFFTVPLLCSCVFYRIRRKKDRDRQDQRGRYLSEACSTRTAFSFDVLDACIMDGFISITKVGGYMILFSIFTALALKIPGTGNTPAAGLLSFSEITTGIPMLMELKTGFEIRWILIMTLCSFGGMCACAQTFSMIHGTGLSIGRYIKEKLAAAAAASFICILYVYFII